MTTSTLAQIIAKTRSVISAIAPANLPDVRFERPQARHVELRELAARSGGSDILRKFDVTRLGPRQDPGVLDPSAYFVERQLLVTVAYPAELPALFGRDDMDDVEDVIEADAMLIRDALFSPSNLANAAHQATLVVVEDVERGSDVWFQTFTLTVKYFSPQIFLGGSADLPLDAPDGLEANYRSLLREHFFGSQTLPTAPPEAYEPNYTPAYPFNTYVVTSPNLLRIDRITHRVDDDIIVYAYHYVNTSGSKALVIAHEGHSYFNLPNHAVHINNLLNLGWNVVLVQMPTIFTAPHPPNEPNPLAVDGHQVWAAPREFGGVAAKAWPFAADINDLPLATATANTNAAWSGADGMPPGCVQFTATAAGTVKLQPSLFTWEDWGVPAGARVLSVQLRYKRRTAANAGMAHTLGVQIIDGVTGAFVTPGGVNGTYINVMALPGAVQPSWEQVTEAIYAVDPAYEASSSVLALKVWWFPTGAGSIDWRMDDMSIAVTYETATLNDPGYVRTFLLPALYVKGHLKTAYGYEQFAMTGLSGGGWTTNMIAALDEDIVASWCVSGSLPWDLRPSDLSRGDFEQFAKSGYGSATQTPTVARPFFQFLPLEYRDLYAMGATAGRLARQVYIENEDPPYFASVGLHPQIDAFIAECDARVTGTVAVSYDTTQTEHEISNFTADVIDTDLESRGIFAVGPTGAPIVDQILPGTIAYYRGDAMTAGQLTDLSGNGNHAVQGNAANQGSVILDPYLRQPVLRLVAGGGGDDSYGCNPVLVAGGAPPAYTHYAMLVVYQIDNGNNSQMIFTSTNASGTAQTGPNMFNLTNGGGTLWWNISAVGQATYVVLSKRWVWALGIHTPTERRLYVNGVLRSTAVVSTSSPAIARIGLGKSLDAAPFWPMTGRIAEARLAGAAADLTAQQIANVRAYVNARYGL